MTVRLIVKPLNTEIIDVSRFEYHFDQDRIVLGRGRGADIRLPHAGVSTHHATIHRQHDQFFVVDHNSTNGTYVNGARLTAMKPKRLHSEDLIAIGEFGLVFQLTSAAVTLTTSERSAELARRIVREVRQGLEHTAVRPTLRVISGPQQGRELIIPPAPCRLIIGRSEHCDLPLSDADASREHVEITSTLDGCFVKDLESKNGVSINGKHTPHKLLSDGDHILIGNTEIIYSDVADARLKALETEDDQTLPVVVHTKTTAMFAQAQAPIPAETTTPPATLTSISHMDLIIYVAAAVIIGLSIAGLVVLLTNP